MIDNNYRLEKLNIQNVDVALTICDEYLGNGMYNRQQLLESAQADGSYYYLIYENTTAAGIFFCSATEAQEAAQIVTADILNYCAPQELIGICNSIAITEPYRKIGLAQMLLRHFYLLLHQEHKVSKVFALAWINRQQIPAANILTQCGFNEYSYVNKPWYDKTGLICPACHKERCECDGILYCKTWRD